MRKLVFLLLIILVLVTSCNTGKLNMPAGVSDSASAEADFTETASHSGETTASDEQTAPIQAAVPPSGSAVKSADSDKQAANSSAADETVRPQELKNAEQPVIENAQIEDIKIEPLQPEKTELAMAENPPLPEKPVAKEKNVASPEIREVKIVTPKTSEVQPVVSKVAEKEPAAPVPEKISVISEPEKKITEPEEIVPETTEPETDLSADEDAYIQNKSAQPDNTVDKTPSRSVTVSVKQYLDVVYPGAGWVYLGEIDESKNLLSFSNRVLDGSDTKFTLRAKTAGVAVLHFYKQDVLTGTYIDDFLEVIVAPDTYNGKEHRTAPSYAAIVPPNQQKYVTRKNATIEDDEDIVEEPTVSAESATIAANSSIPAKTATPATSQATATDLASGKEKPAVNKTIQIDESAPVQYQPASASSTAVSAAPSSGVAASTAAVAETDNIPTDASSMTAEQLLAAAKKAKSQGKLNDSLAYLNVFFDKATAKLDEGWYLRGQLYESAKADFRNIRTSLEAYQMLVDKYPSSTLWKSANNRITYINRFYFKIR